MLIMPWVKVLGSQVYVRILPSKLFPGDIVALAMVFGTPQSAMFNKEIV
jgi:hypothetical protein